MAMLSQLYADPRYHRNSFPQFERPKIIGYIELENLKFAKNIQNNKKVSFNLNLLFDKAKHKDETLDVKLDDLLNFLSINELRLKFPVPTTLDKATFFCYRGLMTCVACTPYENREPWKIVAILHKGSIYLCARNTEEKKARKLNITEKEKRFSSWGYKFEQFLLSDHPDTDPNPNLPVDEAEEFSLVFSTKLSSHSIVYGAEMDGICCDKSRVPPPPNLEMGPDKIIEYLANKEFIELKTSRHIEFPNQERNFRRFKTLKWWCQSFLVGIERIACGFRNDDGVVEELKTYYLKDLVKMSQKFWDPNVCFNFLDKFLAHVKICLAKEIEKRHGHNAHRNLQTIPLVSVLFEWAPGLPVQVTSNYEHEDDPILPKSFIDNYRKAINLDNLE